MVQVVGEVDVMLPDVLIEELFEAEAKGERVELLIPGPGGTLLAVSVREGREASEAGVKSLDGIANCNHQVILQ